MPIHLPPLSRRRFLRGTLAAGAGLFFDGRLVAAGERPVDPHSWALLSDAHLPGDQGTVFRNVNMAANFKAVTAEVCGLQERPAAVLINGDLAFLSGETADYATVTQLLGPLREAGMPLHLTLGNHDDRDHFWQALTEARAAERPVADRQCALIRAPRANWFVLDSLDKVNKTPGLLGDEQRAWLSRALRENLDKPALVVCHHNPGVMGGAATGLQDSDQLLAILRPMKHVKLLLFGHTHDWGFKQDDSGLHLVNLPPTAYVFVVGKPSGWVRCALEENGARLQFHGLDRQHPAHGQMVDLQWRPA